MQMYEKNCDYLYDKACEAIGEIVFRFRHWTKDTILQPGIIQKHFRTSDKYLANGRAGYNLHVFDIRYYQEFFTLQTKWNLK